MLAIHSGLQVHKPKQFFLCAVIWSSLTCTLLAEHHEVTAQVQSVVVELQGSFSSLMTSLSAATGLQRLDLRGNMGFTGPLGDDDLCPIIQVFGHGSQSLQSFEPRQAR